MSPKKFTIPCESFQLISLFSYSKYTSLVYRNNPQMTRLQEQEFNKYFKCVKSSSILTDYSVYLMYICGYVDDKLYCLQDKSVCFMVYFM